MFVLELELYMVIYRLTFSLSVANCTAYEAYTTKC